MNEFMTNTIITVYDSGIRCKRPAAGPPLIFDDIIPDTLQATRNPDTLAHSPGHFGTRPWTLRRQTLSVCVWRRTPLKHPLEVPMGTSHLVPSRGTWRAPIWTRAHAP